MTKQDETLRYGFGKNWSGFIDSNFSGEIVAQSQQRLTEFLRVGTLVGKTFLDIGCGSGLHSLAAHRLGAERVVSFDYDAQSVGTTERLRRLAGDPPNWSVTQGSVLDRRFMEALGQFDIVYSWGVLHHTGDMWGAIRNATAPLLPGAILLIALYSADHHVDPPAAYWVDIKRRYNHAGSVGKRLMELSYIWKFTILPALRNGQNPMRTISARRDRGMEFWTDLRDWLGGYPMDFAGLAQTRDFCKRELGLDLVNIATGEANTEYLFCRLMQNHQWSAIEAGRRQLPLNSPFARPNGHGFTAHLSALCEAADCSAAPRRSRLMLYEDGVPLGLGHSLHDEIAKYGSGRFSHWGEYIYFSASDNSDPNANGKTYTYCESY